MSLFESRDSKDVKCVPTSPKPIHSSSAISSDIFGKGTTNSEIEYLPTKTIDERVLAKIDPDTTSSDSEPSIDMSWCCPSSSFISKNSDTSSLETSFGMMGTPDADISINSDLLFPSTSNTLSNTTLALEDSQPLSLHEDESLWPHRQSNGIDLWRQHFGETTSWESDYIYNWQNPELNLINSGLPSISWAQPYIHQTPLFNNPPGYIPHSTPHQSTIPSQKISNTALNDTNWSLQIENHKYNLHPHPHLNHQVQHHQPSTSPQTLTTSPFHQPRSQYWSPSQSTTTTPSSQQTLSSPDSNNKPNVRFGDSRNKFLVESRRRGLSYRAIKHLGGFKEAESTLRGRFRTLTKTKEQRVRKPKWSDTDIKLLCEAVAIYTGKSVTCHSPDTLLKLTMNLPQAQVQVQAQVQRLQNQLGQSPKVPWKKVSQYIWNNGGSYQFGNATCKKKWCEIHGIKM
ncbi:hypothetical protein PENSTE_c005G10452 [Penicillium steckii]|uniref:Myb-like domain-containing protein n=1 Tax=Penicillium steckii TaxID=303698 RepID=A0A1V6TJH4_9EURO|nr:hypothetical protein PENSTE_c005G10452 [Penicillium steckii]